jgi:hypothetical protein
MKTSILARNAELDALAVLADAGYLRMYSGTQPPAPESAAVGTLLAELRLGSRAFNPAEVGSISAAPIVADPSARAEGVAGWFRVVKADGKTALWDGTVGKAGTDLVLNNTAIEITSRVSISLLTYSLPI